MDVAGHEVHRSIDRGKIGEVRVLVFALNQVKRPIFRFPFDIIRSQDWVPDVDQNPIDEGENPCFRVVIISGGYAVTMCGKFDRGVILRVDLFSDLADQRSLTGDESP